jgi:hypothetical protein
MIWDTRNAFTVVPHANPWALQSVSNSNQKSSLECSEKSEAQSIFDTVSLEQQIVINMNGTMGA